MDINNYRKEISDKKSQIEALKGLGKINKQLAAEISELKLPKKGKSVALQTDMVRFTLYKYLCGSYTVGTTIISNDV